MIHTTSTMIKPDQIVDDALYAFNSGWGYIHGKSGQVWTEEDQNAAEADPKSREQTRLYGRRWVGKRVADGCGLVSWIFFRHRSYMPRGCNSIYNRYCIRKGELKTEDVLLPGCFVFKRSEKYENPFYHIGIYVGGGKVVEAHGTAKGVIKSTLFGWTHYGYPRGVEWGGEDQNGG